MMLIDGYGLIFRAYFAFVRNPLRNDSGENVSAIFGFFRTIFSLLRSYAPSQLVVAMDSLEPTFRHEWYPDYKLTRDRTPEDLRSQIPRIEQLISELGLPTARLSRYESR